MRRLILAFFLLVFVCCATPALAEDVLTLVYSANSEGEFAPCPT